jgi:hypothetical protein
MVSIIELHPGAQIRWHTLDFARERLAPARFIPGSA